MNVRNCRKCGKLYNYVPGPPICPACREALEQKFQEVKEYVRANKIASIPEVAEACDVTQSQIQQWLREERLELAEGSGIALLCEKCGVSIITGRFCEQCKANMANELGNSIRKPEMPKPEHKKDTRENPKMRFLS